MAETEDPRAALAARDITTRAAAARDLALAGTYEDLELLVDRAHNDKSSGVRLVTAAAAADIVARYRGAHGQQTLTAAQGDEVLQWVTGADPGRNPSLLMMLCAVPTQQVIKRIGRLMRDPRIDIRAAAGTALRRMALSASMVDDRLLAPAVHGWLSAHKHPPDATLDLIRLVGEAGWLDLEVAVRAASGEGRLHVEAAEEAIRRLRQRVDASGWAGAWISTGADVLETTDRPDDSTVVLAGGGSIAWPGGAPEPIAIDAGRVGGGRLIWAPTLGQGAEERVAAIQRSGRTYWRQSAADLVKVAEDLYAHLSPAHAGMVDPMIGGLMEIDGVGALRARGILLLGAGRSDEALVVLDDLAVRKKPRADVFWWLARARADVGRSAAALESVDLFLERSAKRAAWRGEAEALRAALTKA